MTNDIAREVEKIAEELGVDRKRSIGEVAQELRVKSHVIRFWEDNFSQIKPEIGAGGRRYYYNKQLKVLRRIKKFLYEEGYTIAGLKRLLSRKKHDDYKEEDLQMIMAENDFLIGDSEEFKQDPRRIEIDDFIISPKEIEAKETPAKIELGSKIEPGAKLMHFANLEIPSIDPKIKNKIKRHLSEAKENLQKLKILHGKL